MLGRAAGQTSTGSARTRASPSSAVMRWPKPSAISSRAPDGWMDRAPRTAISALGSPPVKALRRTQPSAPVRSRSNRCGATLSTVARAAAFFRIRRSDVQHFQQLDAGRQNAPSVLALFHFRLPGCLLDGALDGVLRIGGNGVVAP